MGVGGWDWVRETQVNCFSVLTCNLERAKVVDLCYLFCTVGKKACICNSVCSGTSLLTLQSDGCQAGAVCAGQALEGNRGFRIQAW